MVNSYSYSYSYSCSYSCSFRLIVMVIVIVIVTVISHMELGIALVGDVQPRQHRREGGEQAGAVRLYHLYM